MGMGVGDEQGGGEGESGRVEAKLSGENEISGDRVKRADELLQLVDQLIYQSSFAYC